MSYNPVINNNRYSLFMDVVSRIHDVAKYYEGQGNELSQLNFGGKKVHPNVAVWHIDDLQQMTIVHSPVQPMPLASSVEVFLTNWNNDDVKPDTIKTWYIYEPQHVEDFHSWVVEEYLKT